MTSESSKRVTKYGSYPVMADSIDQFILTSDVACCNFIIAVFLNMSIKTILNAATMFPLMAAAAGLWFTILTLTLIYLTMLADSTGA